MSSAGEQLTDRLRAKIVRGHWEPGKRLPGRPALAREMGTCLGTLQDAVACLVKEGFLEVGSRKKGTRVAGHPPHLSRYRLVFPFGQKTWGQFWHALEAAARQRSGPRQEFLPFYGLSGHRDIADYRRIVNEVRTRQVAGLIFASSAEQLVGTPLLEQPGLPRVAIASKGQLPGIPKVHVDLGSLLRKAVAHLAEQGRRRIALLCASDGTSVVSLFRQAMSARRLEVRDLWIQFASRENPLGAKHVTALLLQKARDERPDGLIVADDNLLTAASEGIVLSCVAVPKDLTVVAATNFPNIVPSAVAVTRIGFDIPALLDLLVLRLEQIHRGQKVPEVTTLPAVSASTDKGTS